MQCALLLLLKSDRRKGRSPVSEAAHVLVRGTPCGSHQHPFHSHAPGGRLVGGTNLNGIARRSTSAGQLRQRTLPWMRATPRSYPIEVTGPQTFLLGRRRCIDSSGIRGTSATWAISSRAPSDLGSAGSRAFLVRVHPTSRDGNAAHPALVARRDVHCRPSGCRAHGFILA
jgi:hypothetical protein